MDQDVLTYRHSTRTSQLFLHPVWKSPRSSGLVWVGEAHKTAETQEGCYKATQVEESLAGSDVGVLLRTEDAQNIVILVDRLAKVPPLLLVPPLMGRVSELALLTGRVRVLAILWGHGVNWRSTINEVDNTGKSYSVSSARRARI